ncbi:M90 family metallopeptidase [Spartinivicinus ruber]|uniref:M90 family metallopeptidase n=1 Tax=Spartinivicinus ruber TaxID=2683272 RepID=UPI0013D0A494|nr:M90 family metallopeptidase [Spartinivicinus ruber]
MLLGFTLVSLLLIGGLSYYLLIYPRQKVKKIISQLFPKQWQQYLQQNVTFYQQLPAPIKQRLHELILLFIHQKKYYGCAGLEITEEIKVTIAAQACLLVVGRPDNWYDKLQSILVYPGSFQLHGENTNDIHSAPPAIRLGESWQNGRIILSWHDVKFGGLYPDDGHNVTFHEFAHQLDTADGYADGLPQLAINQSYRVWTQVFAQEFHRLQAAAQNGNSSVMDYYGATNPAEFFAVATETYFEKPHAMAAEQPELFEQLKAFYKLDPREWLH